MRLVSSVGVWKFYSRPWGCNLGCCCLRMGCVPAGIAASLALTELHPSSPSPSTWLAAEEESPEDPEVFGKVQAEGGWHPEQEWRHWAPPSMALAWLLSWI